MKKILGIIVICLLLTFQPAYGIGRISHWGNVNNTGEQKVTTIPVTTIKAGYHKIIGISIIDISGSNHTEAFCSLEDIVNNDEGGTVAEIIAEAEYGAGGGNEWFTYPLSVTTQIKVHQGAYTEVLIHYAR